MHMQLLRRFSGTRMSYADDAKSMATNYRVLCYVFRHAKMQAFTTTAGSGSTSQWYLLDSRQGQAGCVTAQANCTARARDSLSLHTCKIVTEGKLIKERDRQLRALQDSFYNMTAREEEIALAQQNAEKAKADYEIIKMVLQREAQELRNQGIVAQQGNELAKIQLKEREIDAKIAQLGEDNRRKWAQLGGNALHATALTTFKLAETSVRALTAMSSVSGLMVTDWATGGMVSQIALPALHSMAKGALKMVLPF